MFWCFRIGNNTVIYFKTPIQKKMRTKIFFIVMCLFLLFAMWPSLQFELNTENRDLNSFFAILIAFSITGILLMSIMISILKNIKKNWHELKELLNNE
jgi:hypothetical protein